MKWIVSTQPKQYFQNSNSYRSQKVEIEKIRENAIQPRGRTICCGQLEYHARNPEYKLEMSEIRAFVD